MTSTSVWKALRGPVQIAYAVDDVVSAADSWVARGVGPFFVRHHVEVTNSRIRGRSARFEHSAAFGQWGELMVELFCEHLDDDERVGPRAGLHHVAFFVDDVASAQGALIDHGWEEALYAEAFGNPFAMHDATVELGHLIEIYNDDRRLSDIYGVVRTEARDWDGKDPIRVL